MLKRNAHASSFLDHMVFSNEAHLQLDRYVGN